MNKKAFIGIGMMGFAVALLSGIGIYNSSSSLKSEIKEARAEGLTTYTVSCRDVYDHGVGWGNGDVYFYYEYKEGSTKTAPVWPGTKMNQIHYYDGDAWCHNYITFTPEDEVAFFRFNGGNPSQVETKDIPFFTDRHEEQVYANRENQLTMFKCTIDYVENNATLTYEGITFEPWANPLILPSTAGNYYLGVDVEPIREWYVPEGETSILLNGHTVIPGDASGAFRLVYIREGCTLNIYDNSDIERTYRLDNLNFVYVDKEYNEEHAQQGYIVKGGCFAQASASDNEGFENSGKGGTIYNGGTLNMYSGTIFGGNNYYGGGGVYNDGTFTMYGGTLSRNKSRDGCAIMNTGTATIKEDAIIENNRSSGVGTIVNLAGTLILDGATITNNFASDFGAGIYYAGGKVILKGKVNITGNKISNGSESNFFAGMTYDFDPDSRQEVIIHNYLTIDGGKLSEGSNIGISMDEPGDFTTGLSKAQAKANLPFFTSDDANYSVYRNVETNQLSLIEGEAPEDPAHEHNLTYTADGATITATCSADECDLQDNKATLTLEAPTDLTYSGSAKAATIKAGYDTTVFPNPQIRYYQGNTEVNKCVNVGTYTAKVTFGNAVAMVEFEILGKSIVDPDESKVSIEIDNAVVPENVELRVEVRTDVAEKDIAEDYAKIKEKLESNEQISKVYDVKLIQTVGGVEKEIQPSDIQPGLKITVRMAIPEGVDINNVRILHIHSLEDMEFVSDYVIDGNDLVFEIDRLSQFAFITNVNAGLNGGIIALIIILSILALLGICFLLLFFVFAKFIVIKDKEGKEKVVRAIKIGTDNKDNKNYFWMFMFNFKKELRVKEEVFNKKKDAEEFLKNKVQE